MPTTARRSDKLGAGRQMRDFVYYRCSGSDSYRFGGERISSNSQVQGAFLVDACQCKIGEPLSSVDIKIRGHGGRLNTPNVRRKKEEDSAKRCGLHWLPL